MASLCVGVDMAAGFSRAGRRPPGGELRRAMVRWIDGFYGGLIAGGTSALFYAVVAVAWLHDISFGALFAQVAQALPPFHGAAVSTPLVALGIVLYLLAAAAFGIAYASLARRLPSMGRGAP